MQQHLVPSFPTPADLATLEKSYIDAVVGSWRRMATPSASNTDFTVNAASYVPLSCFVTRVQLVDLDLPASQHLVDAAWNRVYFDQGFAWSAADVAADADARVFTITAALTCEAVTRASVILPLTLDAVTSAVAEPALGAHAVRITLAHRAPTPMEPIAAAFEMMYAERCGVLELVGVPGLGTLPLRADSVADVDAMSFVVFSAELVTALQLAPSEFCNMYLRATPIPGPSALAALLSQAATLALVKASSGANHTWGVYLQYGAAIDRFTLYFHYPSVEDLNGGAVAVIGGGLADRLGFGGALRVDLPRHGVPVTVPSTLPGCSATRGVMFTPPTPVHTVAVCAPSVRVAQGGAFAELEEGTPATPAELVARLNAALNRFSWPAFELGIVLFSAAAPPAGTMTIAVAIAGGNMDLQAAAAAIDAALAASANPVVATIRASVFGGGVMFESATNAVFGLDWTLSGADFDPARVGYDRRAYGAATAHWPPRAALHIPRFNCAPPTSGLAASYRAGENRVVFTPTAFPPFVAEVAAVECGAVGAYDAFAAPPVYVISCADGYRPGLQPGAAVVLADAATNSQQHGVVTACDYSGATASFRVLRTDASAAPTPAASTFGVTTAVAVVPLDAAPATLYMQLGVARVLHANVLGLDAATYEVCTSLTAPGTLDVRRDQFVLIALSFQAGGGAPLMGNMYYPVPGSGGCTSCEAEGSSTLIFAKVSRATCLYRNEFNREFSFDFKGAGIRLGYIHVRILNPDYTLYQAHYHPVSLTLRFFVRQSYVSLGEAADDANAAFGLAVAPPSAYSGQPLLPPPSSLPHH